LARAPRAFVGAVMPAATLRPMTGGSDGRADLAAMPQKEDLNDLQDLILSCNKDGMEALRRAKSARDDPQLKAAFEQFKYAEAMLLANQSEQDHQALLAVTCNNLGCYFKKVGKYHGALSYLRRALKMEVDLGTDKVTLASTHLNICGILSKLEKHDKALQHGLAALDLMCKRVMQVDRQATEDDYAVLAVAYHSVAIEREFFQQWDQAASAFQAGHQVAKRLLGEDHPLSVTLLRNFDAVFAKAKSEKLAKVEKDKQRSFKATFGMRPSSATDSSDAGEDRGVSLPPVPGASPKDSTSPLDAIGRNSLTGARAEATDWVKSEEALWTNFANRALLGVNFASAVGGMASGESIGGASSPSRPHTRGVEAPGIDFEEDETAGGITGAKKERLVLSSLVLADMQDSSKVPPKAHDIGHYKFVSMSPRQLLTKTPFGHALDKHPEALMDLMDADNGASESKVQDFRPNRTMKRQTRTSRVVRRTGVFNSMTHRDRVAEDIAKKRNMATEPWKSPAAQKIAATRIQRVWRSWYQYCQDNSEWMTITWICATMIQSHWRSYHVRRQRMDKAAENIQRFMRGFLVRRVVRKHKAAVRIQRLVVGRITRRKMKHLHDTATHMQRLVRGGLARRRYRKIKHDKFAIVICIQRFVRAWLAKRITGKLAEERRYQRMLFKASVDLQRMFRGWKGRQRMEARRREYLEAKRKWEAAQMIQKFVRGRQARKRVDILRQQRLAEMDKAANFLRKVWLGARTRRKYLQLQREFVAAEDKIVVLQRYMRGCMCRLKLWREAVRTEEELWAAIEIQRSWRGYQGRVQWENMYEAMWRREMAAAMMQRHTRGFLARSKIGRTKRRLARAEFEKARDRFRAAQKMQALVRGVQARKRAKARLALATHAAMQIQRIARGRALRKKMWQQVMEQKAVLLTALARGFLVRARRRRLTAKVIRVQRAYRRWRNRPAEDREALLQKKVERQWKAAVIQRRFRQHAEHKTLQRIGVVALVSVH